MRLGFSHPHHQQQHGENARDDRHPEDGAEIVRPLNHQHQIAEGIWLNVMRGDAVTAIPLRPGWRRDDVRAHARRTGAARLNRGARIHTVGAPGEAPDVLWQGNQPWRRAP
ncbi:protein of unknown function (plasmid) [Cupriavidus taiwanensis]|nr:protein of unknown function [Cupriavidus taiwanensis]